MARHFLISIAAAAFAVCAPAAPVFAQQTPPESAGESAIESLKPARTAVAQNRKAKLPGADQAAIEQFLLQKNYEDWHHKPVRLSGNIVAQTEYSAHGFIRVYYSPGVASWIDPENGPPKLRDTLANDEMIVALEYTVADTDKNPRPGKLRRILSMVRRTGNDQPGAYDGWFWSTTTLLPGGRKVDRENSKGQFGNSRCVSCHASADNESFVFLESKTGAAQAASKWAPGDLKLPESAPPVRGLIRPLNNDSAGVTRFLNYFDLEPASTNDFDRFPPKKFDHVPAPPSQESGPNHFVTSNQCSTCHDASQLYSNTKPNMWYPEPFPDTSLVAKNPDKETHRNFSPFGEWSASLNGLSGRDPVWHAQVEFERRLRPGLARFTTRTCFSCHGPMAGRQLAIDGRQEKFDIEMFYATPESGDGRTRDRDSNIGPHSSAEFAKYGALARDGVSCAVCHQVSAKDLGIDPEFNMKFPTRHLDPDQLNSYSASFRVETEQGKKAYWGPYEEGKLTTGKVASAAMDKALGLRARHGPLLPKDSPFLGTGFPDLSNNPQIRESKLCASCHIVIVPALRVGYGSEPAELHKDKNGNETDDPFLDQRVKMSFEQTTYFEWRNSRYENEVAPRNPTAMTCQACHMTAHRRHDDYPDFDAKRIVNVLSNRYPPAAGRALEEAITYTEKESIYRHVLSGINYFVFEMYEQFPELLGAFNVDPNTPKNTLHPMVNARDWIENHAERITADVAITGLTETNDRNLEAEVEITNLAGHKFPTGAGFRRAFITFEVLDGDGQPLWISGRTSPLGVLLDQNGKTLNSEKTIVPWESQPHHQIITRQDQVQIYETRALNSERQLQTTVLGIYHEYKDNRILPNGWLPVNEAEHAAGAGHHGPPKQNRNLHYSMEPLLVGRPDGDERNDPEHKLHPVLENILRDEGGKPEYEEFRLDDRIRPPALGKSVWGPAETQASYEHVEEDDYFDPSTWQSHPDARVGAQRGQDHVIYRIPLKDIDGWSSVKARLYYQTIPPYFLTDRFKERNNENGGPLVHGPDLKRLAYMASHLNLDKTPAKNWSLPIGKPATADRSDLDQLSRLTNAALEAWVRKRLREHYIHTDLPQDGPAVDKPNKGTQP